TNDHENDAEKDEGDDASSPFVVDSPPEESSDARHVSEKQLAANRRNAILSTGPKTEEGKRKSSESSLVHGAYALHSRPIRRGPFAENAEVVAFNMRETVDAMQPRDFLEQRLAHRTAHQLLTEDRLDALEAAVLEADSVLDAQQLAFVGDPQLAEYLDAVIEVLADVVTDDAYVGVAATGEGWDEIRSLTPWVTWGDLSAYVKEWAFDGKVRVRGVWDEENEPSDDETWRRVLVALLNKKFETPTDAHKWVTQQVLDRRFRDHDADGRAEGLAAHHALHGGFERVVQLRASLDRGLAQLLDAYKQRQAPADE
ncbi:MAG TPA: hypothetical protein VIK61_00870, partial [Acidimicrobiia bacterium]